MEPKTYRYLLRVKGSLKEVIITQELWDQWREDFLNDLRVDKKNKQFMCWGMSDKYREELYLHLLARKIVYKYDGLPKWLVNMVEDKTNNQTK